MGSFGNAGMRTVRTNVALLAVDLSAGEYLFYEVTVGGAEAAFVFTCEHRTLLESTDFPDHPQQVYRWVWSAEHFNSDNSDDVYTVMLSFLSAINYTLLVEHRKADDSLIAKLKDIDYTSQDPNDKFRETIEIFSS